MLEFSVDRMIHAPADRIWQVLVDRRRLASGAFGILSLEGQIAAGGRLRLRSAVVPQRVFSLTVRDVVPGRSMVWAGGMPLGLFTGRRQFTLVPEGDGTRFTMREIYTGPLAGLIGRSMPDLTPSFEQFAAALASATEATR